MERIDTQRSLLKYVLLTIVTCGIYGLYFTYELARDINIMCAEDGKTTPGLLKLVLLSLVTCGIYSFVWYYALGNRIQANANEQYGLNVSENGTTVLLWMIIGTCICGIASLVATNIIIKNTNAIANEYNARLENQENLASFVEMPPIEETPEESSETNEE